MKSTEIIQLTADLFRVTPEQMKTKSRKRNLVYARQLSMTLIWLKDFNGPSEVGATVNRSHTNMIYSRREVSKRYAKCADFRDRVLVALELTGLSERDILSIR